MKKSLIYRLFDYPIHSSESENAQIRNQLKVADVVRRDAIAKFKSGNADQKVGERDTDSFSLALAVDLTGAQRNRRCDWMHRNDGH